MLPTLDQDPDENGQFLVLNSDVMCSLHVLLKKSKANCYFNP